MTTVLQYLPIATAQHRPTARRKNGIFESGDFPYYRLFEVTEILFATCLEIRSYRFSDSLLDHHIGINKDPPQPPR